MSEKSDGGPAFPSTPSHPYSSGDTGMSLRDWFAGQIVSGLVCGLSRTEKADLARNGPLGDSVSDMLAGAAYTLAGAMISARGR